MGRTAQINTFGGGVNEVQREIVAWMGLGMTRADGADGLRALRGAARARASSPRRSSPARPTSSACVEIDGDRRSHRSRPVARARGGRTARRRASPRSTAGWASRCSSSCFVLEQQGRLRRARAARADAWCRRAARSPSSVRPRSETSAAGGARGRRGAHRCVRRARREQRRRGPRSRATHGGRRCGRSSGTKIAVPAAHVADAMLVPAMTDDGLTVFLVPTDADGIDVGRGTRRPRVTMQCTVHFDEVEVDDDDVARRGRRRRRDRRVDHRSRQHRRTPRSRSGAVHRGACGWPRSTRAEREQFGRPLSTNQGVAIRAADAYIDIDCMRVTLWHAAWRLDARPAGRATRSHVAKYWAAEGGQRVVHATQHLHGGMGADVDYPVHRTFLWVKQLENIFGSGPQHLARLGASHRRRDRRSPMAR